MRRTRRVRTAVPALLPCYWRARIRRAPHTAIRPARERTKRLRRASARQCLFRFFAFFSAASINAGGRVFSTAAPQTSYKVRIQSSSSSHLRRSFSAAASPRDTADSPKCSAQAISFCENPAKYLSFHHLPTLCVQF